jgi:hypothetical protein
MKTKILILLSVAACLPAVAYTPPIGIPNPQWGTLHPIDAQPPPEPSSWPGQPTTNCYYIDNTHVLATDTNNPYGFPAKPRATIPATYASGARIEVHGGPYTGSQLIMTFAGTEIAPCWFFGVNHPIIQRETILKGAYVLFDGFRFNVSRRNIQMRPHSSSNLHHAVVRNCVFEGSGINDGFAACVAIYGTAGNRFHNIVIARNTIRDFGDDDASVENDYHGILCSQETDNVWVLENTVHHMGGDSIQIGTASIVDSARVTRIFAGGNVFHDNLENAIDIKEANDIVISGNHCYGFLPADTLGGVAIVIHNDPSGVWCLYNRVHAAGVGIQTTGSRSTWFIGNVIYDIHHNPAESWDPNSAYSSGAAMHMRSSNGGCAYNTLHDYDVGLQLPTGAAGYLVKGNIFANRVPKGGDDILVPVTSVAAITAIDYNCYTNMAVNHAGRDFMDPAAMLTSTGKETHGIEVADIRFVDADNRNYSLRQDSPPVNAGPTTETSSFLDDFRNRFGIDLRMDALAVTRPRGTAWDLGAYEYPGAPVIAPPGSLKVTPIKPDGALPP